MGQLGDRMEQDLILKRYRPATRKVFLLDARKFTVFYRTSPEELGELEIHRHL